MLRLCLSLILVAFAIALPLGMVVRSLSRRFHAVDSAGVPGQVKAARRWVPNTGGVVVFWAFALPVLAVMVLAMGPDPAQYPDLQNDPSLIPADIEEHMAGLKRAMPLAWLVLGGALLLHVLGLIDDRRPLGPFLKLGLMAIPAIAVPLVPELPGMDGVVAQTRLLTVLDQHVGGAWLSIVLTAVYILVLVNAMNFMDNMDGLSAGIAAIASACLLGVALSGPEPQWFVAGFLALLLGALLGFLVFNFPFTEWSKERGKGGASIFLGDGGSLVVGFLLAFLSIRITYLSTGDSAAIAQGAPWHVLLTPLIVLAVPLYDFASVVVIRVSQGKSPFVGDLQHLSHRIEQKGLSRRQAVLVIYLFSAGLGMSGMLLPTLAGNGPYLLFAQCAASLGALALFEWSHAKRRVA